MHNLTQRIKQHPIYSLMILFVFLVLVLTAPGNGLKNSSPYHDKSKDIQADYAIGLNECRTYAEEQVKIADKDKWKKQLITLFFQCIEDKDWNHGRLYGLGWADGCETGTNAVWPLFMPSLTWPFIKRQEMAPNEQYKQGWNEGFTVCRFNQSAWFGMLALALILLTLILTRCRCRSK